MLRGLAARLQPSRARGTNRFNAQPGAAGESARRQCDPRRASAPRSTNSEPRSGARGVIARLEAPNASAPRSPRSRSATTGSSATTSRLPSRTRARSARLRAQADPGQRRALHHPGAEGLEGKILTRGIGAEELELQLFTKLLRDLQSHAAAILETARAVGEFDATMSLARRATRGFVRPTQHRAADSRARRTPSGGRAGMLAGEFVPNDLELTGDAPNPDHHRPQHGRQIDLSAAGGADRAHGADRQLRARPRRPSGSRSRLHAGRRQRQSAPRRVHLHGRDERDGADPAQAPARSLLVLDEFGRGTCTFDGLSIAWAVAEYPHDRIGPRCCSRPTFTS